MGINFFLYFLLGGSAGSLSVQNSTKAFPLGSKNQCPQVLSCLNLGMQFDIIVSPRVPEMFNQISTSPNF